MNYVYKLNNGTKRILGETGFWGLLRLEAWGKRKCVCVSFLYLGSGMWFFGKQKLSNFLAAVWTVLIN